MGFPSQSMSTRTANSSGRSQNTVPIASTQVAIKGIVQHSTSSSTVQLRVELLEQLIGSSAAEQSNSRSLDADESTRSAQVE